MWKGVNKCTTICFLIKFHFLLQRLPQFENVTLASIAMHVWWWLAKELCCNSTPQHICDWPITIQLKILWLYNGSFLEEIFQSINSITYLWCDWVWLIDLSTNSDSVYRVHVVDEETCWTSKICSQLFTACPIRNKCNKFTFQDVVLCPYLIINVYSQLLFLQVLFLVKPSQKHNGNHRGREYIVSIVSIYSYGWGVQVWLWTYYLTYSAWTS